MVVVGGVPGVLEINEGAPERVDPGNAHYDVRNTPKLVAGVTPQCRNRVEALYRCIVDDVVLLSSTMVAELAKLHENTFRAVNIASTEAARSHDRHRVVGDAQEKLASPHSAGKPDAADSGSLGSGRRP